MQKYGRINETNQTFTTIPSEDLAVIVQEGAKTAYNGGKKLGGYISDIIDAIFD